MNILFTPKITLTIWRDWETIVSIVSLQLYLRLNYTKTIQWLLTLGSALIWFSYAMLWMIFLEFKHRTKKSCKYYDHMTYRFYVRGSNEPFTYKQIIQSTFLGLVMLCILAVVPAHGGRVLPVRLYSKLSSEAYRVVCLRRMFLYLFSMLPASRTLSYSVNYYCRKL